MKTKEASGKTETEMLNEIHLAGWGKHADPEGLISQTLVILREIEGIAPSPRLRDTTRKNPAFVAALRDIESTEWLENGSARRRRSARKIADAEALRKPALAIKTLFEDEFEKRLSGWPALIGRRVIAAIARGDHQFFLRQAEYLKRTGVDNLIPAARVDRIKVEVLAHVLDIVRAARDKPSISVRSICAFLIHKGYSVGQYRGAYTGDVSRKQIQQWLAEWNGRGWLSRDITRGNPNPGPRRKR